MLKTRVIPTLLFKEHGLVKGKRFDSNRTVGTAVPQVKVYNLREVDELIFLDVVATNHNKKPNLSIVKEISDVCYVPLTVGGGIKTLYDIEDLLKNGADKISINTAAIKDPSIIAKASKVFGCQCITVSIDFRLDQNKTPIVCLDKLSLWIKYQLPIFCSRRCKPPCFILWCHQSIK